MPRVATAKDASGKITVSLFQEVALTPQNKFTDFAVKVDEDMVVIGGGGRGDDTIGALLTASYPREDMTAWLVSSKDHVDADPHYLTGFAVGMKIDGMTRDQLFDVITVFQEDSDPDEHPSSTVSIPGDSLLLGGGFRANWQGAGSLATASFPAPDQVWTSWHARSKDQEIPETCTITAFAISIPKTLTVNNVTLGTLKLSVIDITTDVEPHPHGTAVLPDGFVLTGGGALVHWTGAGNLLWQLEPNLGAFTAGSKDHDAPDPSTLTPFALGVQLQQM